GARGVAGQRIDHADLDWAGGVIGAGENSGQDGDDAARGSVHGFLPLRHQPGWKPHLNEKPARLSIALRWAFPWRSAPLVLRGARKYCGATAASGTARPENPPRNGDRGRAADNPDADRDPARPRGDTGARSHGRVSASQPAGRGTAAASRAPAAPRR